MPRTYIVTFLLPGIRMVTVEAQGNTRAAAARRARGKLARQYGYGKSLAARYDVIDIQHKREQQP